MPPITPSEPESQKSHYKKIPPQITPFTDTMEAVTVLF